MSTTTIRTETIIEAIEQGITDWEPGMLTPAVVVALTLIGAGITAPDCDDDEYALADLIGSAWPCTYASHYMASDKLAAKIAEGMGKWGGFVQVPA